MADCYWHGYSGSPGPCHTCEIMRQRGENPSEGYDTVTRCECGSGIDAQYCGKELQYLNEPRKSEYVRLHKELQSSETKLSD